MLDLYYTEKLLGLRDFCATSTPPTASADTPRIPEGACCSSHKWCWGKVQTGNLSHQWFSFEQDELCEQLGRIIVQPTVAEQTPQNSAPSAPPAKKLEAKKMDLFAMEQEILKNVKLIRHDGGVYYFNGVLPLFCPIRWGSIDFCKQIVN